MSASSPARGYPSRRPRARIQVPKFERLASLDSKTISVVSPEKTLVVFDFDCTLSAVHLFHTLRSPEGQQEYRADRDAFFSNIWGGAERILAIQQLLRKLHDDGFRIYILSFGNERDIREALHFINISNTVDAIYGNSSYAQCGVFTIQNAKVQMIDIFQERLKTIERILFFDDDRTNFPDHISGSLKFDRFSMDTSSSCISNTSINSKNSKKLCKASTTAKRGQKNDLIEQPVEVSTQIQRLIEFIIYPAGAFNGGLGLSIKDMDEIIDYITICSGIFDTNPPAAPFVSGVETIEKNAVTSILNGTKPLLVPSSTTKKTTDIDNAISNDKMV